MSFWAAQDTSFIRPLLLRPGGIDDPPNTKEERETQQNVVVEKYFANKE